MALVALIGATERVADGDGLRALLPVAGQTLFERQVDQLRQVGAERVFVALEAVTPDLIAAIDRLQARGATLIAVRTLADLAPRLRPDDRVLLVADGLHAPPAHIRALADSPAPTLVAVPDTAVTRSLERIDATARWAGLASLSGADVADLAAMPGEWDLVLTLFRRAVQADARRIQCSPDLFAEGAVAVLDDRADVAPVEARALAAGHREGPGLGTRLVAGTLVRLFGGGLVRGAAGVRLAVLAGLAVAGFAIALGVGAFGAAVAVGALASLIFAALRYRLSFRHEAPLVVRVGGLGNIASLAMLAALGVALGIADRGDGEGVRVAALVTTACLLVTVARELHARGLSPGPGDRAAWLPDVEQAWLALGLGLALQAVAAAALLLTLAMAAQLALYLGARGTVAPRRASPRPRKV